MRLDRLITLGFVRPLRALGRGFGRSSSSDLLAPGSRRLPILMYHSISDDPEPGVHPYYRVCTSPKRFAEHMQWLKQAGYRAVTLREGLAWVKAGEDGSSKSEVRSPASSPSARLSSNSNLPSSKSELLVALTFDDGFHDFYTAAWPILRQHGFTATMYLPTAFIGDTRRSFQPSALNSQLSTPRDCLTWNEIRELHAAGVEFGSHTVNHPKLTELSWSLVQSEISNSRSEIGNRLGVPVTTFAHPYAFPQEDQNYVSRIAALLAETGYTNAVTTRIGTACAGDSCFTLCRLPANSDDDESLLLAKLSGNYDCLAWPQAVARKLKRAIGGTKRAAVQSTRAIALPT